jgi:hypothetical protein
LECKHYVKLSSKQTKTGKAKVANYTSAHFLTDKLVQEKSLVAGSYDKEKVLFFIICAARSPALPQVPGNDWAFR